MAVTRQKKEEILSSLTEKFGRSKSVIFAKNMGLSVEQMSHLRTLLREKGAEFVVAKKTLLQKAAEANGIEGVTQDVLEGAIGVAFSYEDQIFPAKVLTKFSKQNENLVISIGIMDHRVLSKSEVIALSALPSREELLAKFMGSLLAPLSGFVGIGNALIGGFVRALDGVRAQKEAA